jgi:hypothetical protein
MGIAFGVAVGQDWIERYRETKFLHHHIGELSVELLALKWCNENSLAGPVN